MCIRDSGKRGRGTDKAKIVVALSKTENGAALFTRMQVVEDVTGGTLQQVVDETVAPDSKIECDGYRSYRNLSGVEDVYKRQVGGYPAGVSGTSRVFHWRITGNSSGHFRDFFMLFRFCCLSVLHAPNVGVVNFHRLWCVFGPFSVSYTHLFCALCYTDLKR